MGEEEEACFPKLKLPSMEIPESPEHPSTPPFQASASVPFKWEEQPGKPRPCSLITAPPEPAKSLDLPPHRFTKTPSPTTVLDGPYNVARPKFSSFRYAHRSFRSPEGTTVEALLRGKKSGGGFFGKKLKGGKRVVDGAVSCRFSPASVSSSCESEEMFVGVKSNCGVKMSRNGSFSSISHQAKSSSSQIWTSIYQGIKQVMHWKSSTKKSNKQGRERD